MPFKDRHEAGKRLVIALDEYKNNKDVIILAIPRGGLVTGYELAVGLNAPLDIIVTKKIGYPGNPEYAIGAVGPGKEIVLNEQVIEAEGISRDYIDNEVKELEKAIKERYEKYRGKKPLPDLKDKIVIICDDGVATGSTMIAGIHIIKKQKPKKIIVAVPVGPPDTISRLEEEADEVVCLEIPEMFFAIGAFYEEFLQVEDEEAIEYLKKAEAAVKKKK